MLADLNRLLPPEAVQILLVLFLSFLTGLEREEHKQGNEPFSFGGVRTFPLIGLISYAISLVAGGQIVAVTIGFAVIAAFLMLSYQHKLRTSSTAGITSEMSALTTYLVAALVYREQYWIATTLTIASMLLLELKSALEGLARRIPPQEILSFTKFLLLTAVILPVLPNREFGPFRINPANTWLVVVAVSTVSYASYVIQKVTQGRGGVVLTALLGGAYSSTVTTVVLARRAPKEKRPHLFAGAALMASGVMYARLAVLVALFNRSLVAALALPFGILAAVVLAVGWAWTLLPDAHAGPVAGEAGAPNPLELRAALLFAALFLAMLVITRLAVTYLGQTGVYSLAALTGVTDVTPFIMGMTQAGGTTTSLTVAASAILIAAASNNLIRGIYAYALADRSTGVQSLILLTGAAAAGLAPLAWLAR